VGITSRAPKNLDGVKLDWVLAGPISRRPEACRRAGTGHLGGTLDEIVVWKPSLVHLEQMSDTLWWCGIYLGPDRHDRVTFDLWTPRTLIRASYALEVDAEGDSFEGGQYSSGIKLPPWMREGGP